MFAKFLITAAVAVAGTLSALPTAADAGNWGAIAYSEQTRTWGYSRNYESRTTAVHIALLQCRVRSPNGCQLVTTFQNACGSLAVGPDGWGSGWGATRARAQSEARGVCGRWSRTCTIRETVCSN